MMMAQSQIGACGCLRLGAQLAAISRRACLPAKQRAEAIVVMRQHGATLALLEYLRADGTFRREGEIMAATGRKDAAMLACWSRWLADLSAWVVAWNLICRGSEARMREAARAHASAQEKANG